MPITTDTVPRPSLEFKPSPQDEAPIAEPVKVPVQVPPPVVGGPKVVEGSREGPVQSDALVELVEGQRSPGVGREGPRLPEGSRTCGQAAGIPLGGLPG